jgi:apolipoprotein N-acyltransferase
MPTFAAVMLSLIPFGLGAFLMTLSFWCYKKAAKIVQPIIADILLISFWLSYEYLHQTWDLKFPWMNLGNGFSATPQLIQWYEYTGVFGGTLWVLVSNILIFRVWKAFKVESQRLQVKKLSISLAAWIVIPIAFSIYTYTTYQEEINPANVVVVQPNIDPYAKNFSLTPQVQVEKLIALSKQKAQTNTEFFIWPETAITGSNNENDFRNTTNFQNIQSLLDSFKNATIISGIDSYLIYDTQKTPSAKFSKENNFWWDSFNAAVAIENTPKLQFYHKSKLVPGVERMPFPSVLSILNPLFENFGGTTGGYGYQTEPSNLYAFSGIGVVPSICYESIWGSWVAKSVQKEAQFIAVITNDGWWGNTSGKDQHLHYARLRAIENRRWVARSANTGISAFINQRGDIVQRTKWWEEAVIKQNINLNSDFTFYTQYPDWLIFPFLFLGGFGVMMLIFSMFRRNKQEGN